ncbi:Spermidine/putrescine import ATP-binding protein PotA [Variovorax sp. PBS-H4]|uniref:ABC transporter ATP-binding protein n=1 Tax=Variovorax sp. PBS-H4 TaxID=434008 RepID=UPI001316CBAF|nr:ABC transporter ATP-binding protein [Variovorax sp. PBS-H4]VTU27846.1 Spermidine/putrescine import ATP-binding protein PotA [Variovorax sp. PBS-H4]
MSTPGTTAPRTTRVQLDGLRKRFDNAPAPAIAHLDLQTEEGEFISLLGPSGCGKTTTLRCVAGFEFPDEGRVRLNDEDITDLPPEKRDIGMVFQNYALFPHLTVWRNLAFGLEMRGTAKAECKRRIDDVLAMVQLTNMAERYPRQLSGGQQQRVALARALVIEPRLLLLDEPLANLDAVLREDMRVFIRELQKRVGITTLYVTHDQAEAMVMSDRVAVMLGGKLLQFDVPEAIYMRPRSVEVARFIGRSNLIAGHVEGMTDAAGAYPTYRVSTALGSVPASHDQPLVTGQPVHVTIRPEAVRFMNDGPYGGLVRSAYFLGSTVEHTVECAGGQSLLVQTSPGQRFEAGANAAFAFDPGHAWIVASTP